MSYEDANCDHDWEKGKETDMVGPNLFGKQVQCYGWDVVCRKCNATSWVRDNEKTKQEDDGYILSHFI